MPINFTPRRSAILMCDFDMAYVPPEMRKVRRVVILSPTAQNKWTSADPGLSTVVPLSATAPRGSDPRSVLIPAGTYSSLTIDVWAKCGMIDTVSNSRLDRVKKRERGQLLYLNDRMTAADMASIEVAIRAALDMP